MISEEGDNMSTKVLFLISTILIVFIIIFSVNISYASDVSDVITGGDNFIGAADDNAKIDETKLKLTSDLIYQILMVLGISIAVIIAGILGIKFMIGSVEEKAQVKDQLIPFVIGCIVIFGAFSIWKVAVNIGNSIEQDPNSSSYTKKDDGKLYCDDCGDVLTTREQRNGKCLNCDKYIEGI